MMTKHDNTKGHGEAGGLRRAAPAGQPRCIYYIMI